MEQIRLLAIVGPTASGKTALSIELAKRLGGEIVSCDSMQVYRGMNVGTAKPTEDEKCGVPHHLIDVADATAPFSVAEYVTLAQAAIADICTRGKVPVICGGTGLYLDALLRGGLEETESDPALRKSLFDYAEAHGAHALHERLRAVDPESADAIHENNVKRVVRALEIYESTGVTKTASDKQSREQPAPYDATVLGLFYPDRTVLYDRIARRVEIMLADGLTEETAALCAAGVFEANATAAQAIGYKEILPALRGEETLAAATERLITATRRYAKRQLTWFRAKDYVRWLDMTDADGKMRALDAIADEAVAIFQK
ncbi:MAG: tRNA (adenosine(37)-N6)-dimethylallyltransferase MiaA [Clostridia bacterium]|nr:tRNA (adenosine(37)-N6)-dimethylallyltransferase MiaA [Clostridia bacterium]